VGLGQRLCGEQCDEQDGRAGGEQALKPVRKLYAAVQEGADQAEPVGAHGQNEDRGDGHASTTPASAASSGMPGGRTG
jgi:hypothetical protein